MSRCPNCPTVPVVSDQLAERIVQGWPEELRGRAIRLAIEWLTTRHPGLSLYEGISGRPYSREEKDRIAVETAAVAALPCPFHSEGGCAIGSLGPDFNRVEETAKAPYGWLPTLVARWCDRDGYRGLVRARAVADAKVALLTRNEYFLSPEDLPEHTVAAGMEGLPRGNLSVV